MKNKKNSPTVNSIPRVALVDLGCAKNTVDSEIILCILLENNFTLSTDINKVELLLINTCGFIDSAKQESINNLKEAVHLKRKNPIMKVVAIGCLAERYKKDLLIEIPELDGIVGLGAYDRILEICKDILNNKSKDKVMCDKNNYRTVTEGTRLLLTGESFAYLRIADGCDNCCSYCAVPLIRGKFRSRNIKDIVDEAKTLIDSGIQEIDIIAQDVTSFGKDKNNALPELIEELLAINSKTWFRLLYAHPAHLKKDVVNLLAKEKQLLGYLDLPIQHINNRILTAMGRGVSKHEIVDLISSLRENVKNIILRTTVICGFPGETDTEFLELLEYVKTARFEHLGAFSYSKEVDTAAYNLPNQIPEQAKENRVNEIMSAQQEITFNWLDSRIEKKEEILLDNYLEKDILIGRSRCEAPDIDGIIVVKGNNLHPGELVLAQIERREDYDLVASI